MQQIVVRSLLFLLQSATMKSLAMVFASFGQGDLLKPLATERKRVASREKCVSVAREFCINAKNIEQIIGPTGTLLSYSVL